MGSEVRNIHANIHDSKDEYPKVACIKETGVVTISENYTGPVIAMSLKRAERLSLELAALCEEVRRG